MCPVPTPSKVDTGSFEHRWAGLVHDSFTLDGEEVWTGEDGGRIRHRDPTTGAWSFQDVPFDVQGMIRRIHFNPNGLDGWAVSADGWVLGTQNGGASWDTLARIPAILASSTEPWEELYDIHFEEEGLNGWLVALHGLFYTVDGGVCWEEASIYYPAGDIFIGPNQYATWNIEHYAIDVRIGQSYDECPPGEASSDFLGLVVSQPGLILRSIDEGRVWSIVVHPIYDLCPMLEAPCFEDGCSGLSASPWIELWDVEISDDPSEPLALVVGGVRNGCGLVLASEDHGCTWSLELHECEGDPERDCSTDIEYDDTQPVYRHSSFATLYGVGIFDHDNTAVASGYSGQHLRRDFLADGTPVWRDRSEFGEIADAPLLTTIFPLYGASTEDGLEATGKAWITGAGGHIRHSDDGGDTWQAENLGEPFRITDVWFKTVTGNPDQGWQVGQRFRLARSNDGGATWIQGEPPPNWPMACTLHSITFAGDGDRGVTVGTHIPAPDRGPRILWTDDFGQLSGWSEPTSITYTSQAEQDVHRTSTLREVCWAGDENDLHFWAVGSKGLVLRTTDGGDTWEQIPLDPVLVSDPHEIDLHGVAAASPNSIIVVGSEEGGLNPGLAKAYAYVSSAWFEITVDAPGAGTVERLLDVSAVGSSTYAVGQRQLAGGGGPRSGVVLRYDPSQTAFVGFPGPFAPAEIAHQCPDFGAGLDFHVLTEVEVMANGDVWIAGLCGQVWQYVASEAEWQEHKSRTDADFRGMMFLSSQRGYFAGHGGRITNQVVVRYQDPN